MRVAVVYWSATGNTEAMAEEVALGVRDAGAEVLLAEMSEVKADDIATYDRIILGAPAMGIEEVEEFEVRPFTEALLPSLDGKEVGLFGSCGWSRGEWLLKWAKELAAAGATFLHAPVRGVGYPDADVLAECRELGVVMGTVYPEA